MCIKGKIYDAIFSKLRELDAASQAGNSAGWGRKVMISNIDTLVLQARAQKKVALVSELQAFVNELLGRPE